MTKAITVKGLAREAGVSPRTARLWLSGQRNTRPANEAKLEAALISQGGVVAQSGSTEAFLSALLGLPVSDLKT